MNYPQDPFFSAPAYPVRPFLFSDYATGRLCMQGFTHIWFFLVFLAGLWCEHYDRQYINPAVGIWN
jgi:hypothetical protein